MALKKPSNLSLEEMAAALREAGFKVEQQTQYVKHTFEIETALLKRFFELKQELGLRVKDAINEAIAQWVEAKIRSRSGPK